MKPWRVAPITDPRPRDCLQCDRHFIADGPFIRLCPICREGRIEPLYRPFQRARRDPSRFFILKTPVKRAKPNELIERNKRIVAMRLSGRTFREVADAFRISADRARSIFKRHETRTRPTAGQPE